MALLLFNEKRYQIDNAPNFNPTRQKVKVGKSITCLTELHLAENVVK